MKSTESESERYDLLGRDLASTSFSQNIKSCFFFSRWGKPRLIFMHSSASSGKGSFAFPDWLLSKKQLIYSLEELNRLVLEEFSSMYFFLIYILIYIFLIFLDLKNFHQCLTDFINKTIYKASIGLILSLKNLQNKN